MTKENELVNKYLHLVNCIVSTFRYVNIGYLTLEDLYQEGCIGLINGIEKGNENHKYFQAYLCTSIRHEILKAIKKAVKVSKREKYGAEVELFNAVADIEDTESDLSNIFALEVIEGKIKETDKKKQKGYTYLVFSANGYTLEEIGKIYGEKNFRTVSAYMSACKNFIKSNEDCQSAYFSA